MLSKLFSVQTAAPIPEDENEDEVMPETRIDVEVPKINTNIGIRIIIFY